MPLPLTRRRFVGTTLTAGAAAISAHRLGRSGDTARAASSYTFVDIGETQPDALQANLYLAPNAITADGTVLGNLWVSAEKNSPYVFADGDLDRIKTGAYGARATAINASGVIAGREITGWTTEGNAIGRPAIWVDGEKTLLPTPDGLWAEVVNAEVWGLNDAGAVAGTLTLADGSLVATLWTDGVPVILPDPFGAFLSEARAIDETSRVGGVVRDAANNAYPVAWEAGAALVMPAPEAGLGWVEGAGIGTDGSFTGVTFVAGKGEAILWRDGTYQLLASPSGDYTNAFAEGVNAGGIACGAVVRGQTKDTWSALIWQDGVATELSDLVDLDPGVRLLRATAINDAGQIVGGALWPDGSLHAFLLNPS